MIAQTTHLPRQRWLRILFLPLSLLVYTISSGLNLYAAPLTTTNLWFPVEAANAQGLPEKALTELQSLEKKIQTRKDWGQIGRLIGYKVGLSAMKQENPEVYRIQSLAKEIPRAPVPLRPMLETLLAQYYWSYANNHRWEIAERIPSLQPTNDVTQWDMPRWIQALDNQFAQALKNQSSLKRTPTKTFEGLLTDNTLGDAYQPTAFDFIGHQALDYYAFRDMFHMDPQGQERRFEVDGLVYGEVPLFGTPESFVAAGKFEHENPETGAEKAFFLYRELTRFHLKDPDPTPLVDLTLARLEWAKRRHPNIDSRRRLLHPTLQNLAERYSKWPISADVWYALAKDLFDMGHLVEAHTIVESTMDRFPESRGGKASRSLKEEIEMPSLHLTTDRLWNPNTLRSDAKLHVHHKNTEHVWFRAVPLGWEENLNSVTGRSSLSLADLLRRAPEAEWDTPLSKTFDFKEREEVLPGPPQLLKSGLYRIFCSVGKDFSTNTAPLSFADIWVSRVGLLIRSGTDRIDGLVVDSHSGEPLTDAIVESWESKTERSGFAVTQTWKTDALGTFTSRKQRGGNQQFIRVVYQGETIGEGPVHRFVERFQNSEEGERVFLFTDRSLYRPGQTFFYKGIACQAVQSQARYQTLSNASVELVLKDSNGQIIRTAQHRCNDLGSFVGSLVLPQRGLLGSMRLEIKGHPEQGTQIQVEEYRRPQFHFSLHYPKQAPHLGEWVTVEGIGTTYTGTPIDRGRVRWKVVREFYDTDEETDGLPLATGKVSTDSEGRFEIRFHATSPRSASITNDSIVYFSISADMTDATGETHSKSLYLPLGLSELKLSLKAEAYQSSDQPTKVHFNASRLDDEPQAFEGTLSVYSLLAPKDIDPFSPHALNSNRAFSNPSEPEGSSDPYQWSVGPRVHQASVRADKSGRGEAQLQLPAGFYRFQLESPDRSGNMAKTVLSLQVIDRSANRYSGPLPFYLEAPRWTIRPGESVQAVWGTGYEVGRAFIEIESQNKIISRYWTPPDRTQFQIEVPAEEANRGGITLRVTQVHKDLAYSATRIVEIPWDQQELQLSWEHFRSKLEPGQKESWTLVIQPPTEKNSIGLQETELLAALYDASLDSIHPRDWPRWTHLFRRETSWSRYQFSNIPLSFLYATIPPFAENPPESKDYYRRFRPEIRSGDFLNPPDLAENDFGLPFKRVPRWGTVLPNTAMAMAAPAPMEKVASRTQYQAEPAKDSPQNSPSQKTGSTSPQIRRDLRETAFFLPQLRADSNGVVRMEFSMPDSLTSWRFRAWAHDAQMRYGYLETNILTAKDLMVQPLMPRFVREGDTLEFTVKVSNASDAAQEGTLDLQFLDPLSEPSTTSPKSLLQPPKAFRVAAQSSQTYAWRVKIPEGLGSLLYRVVGKTQRFQDAEEGIVPVLARKMEISETLPMQMEGPGAKRFRFETLIRSSSIRSLEHQSLTVQVVPQPEWHAVLSLPYLMEFPHECAEQTMNRIYANALALHLIETHETFAKKLKEWRDTGHSPTPWQRGEHLSQSLLEETPWVRQALQEKDQRQRLAQLLEPERARGEIEQGLQKLSSMQRSDGQWSWFPDGPADPYMTLYVATSFGRLRHLGVDIAPDLALRAWDSVESWIREHGPFQTRKLNTSSISLAHIAMYLYGRSFFLKERPLTQEMQGLVKLLLDDCQTDWTKTESIQTQAHIALALHRFGRTEAAVSILDSLEQRSIYNTQSGRFWSLESSRSARWEYAPIESQALLCEAFDEITHRTKIVQECKQWLIQQRRTHSWVSTKATADAIYALSRGGFHFEKSSQSLKMTLGSSTWVPTGTEGSEFGWLERRYTAKDIRASMGEITLEQSTDGISWASLHWQYLQDVESVRSSASTACSIQKRLFLRSPFGTEPALIPFTGTGSVGDELVVRLQVFTDRDLQYVHLKDQRGSGTEPMQTISGYQYRDGMGWYQSSKDTATHFFIDSLKKGTHVLEYSVRLQHSGDYSSGIAEMECQYAPEFSAHSVAIPMRVTAPSPRH